MTPWSSRSRRYEFSVRTEQSEADTRRPEERLRNRAKSDQARFSDRGRKVRDALLAIVFVQLACTSAHADWMNLTGAETAPNIAEVIVLDDRVTVRLEIYVGDLEAFSDLIPNQLLKDGGEGRSPESERLAHFASSVLGIRGPDGVPLSAELKLAEPRLRVDRKSPYAGMINPQTRQPVPEAPADKRVLFAEIDYRFNGKPSAVTIFPPTDESGSPLVNIGFIAYHKAVPVIDFRYLSATTTLRLDWNDPWYSRFDNPNLRRHHKNALMSFLYIEPREVRHEVLIRVRDLQDWVDLELDGDAEIDATEQAAIKHRARVFFEAHNLLRIEGAPREPTSSRAEFLNISIKGLAVFDEGKPLESSTAIVGVILSYPVKQLPQSVHVDWELFNERNGRIPTTATDPAGPLASFVDVENPTIEWQNFLRKYVDPKVTPVTIDAGNTLAVPIASLLLLLVALTAAGWAMRSKNGTRLALAGASLLCVIAAILLMRSNTVAIHSPLAGPPDEALSARIIEAVLDNVHTAYLEQEESQLTQALSMVIAEQSASEIKAELGRALAIKVAGGGIARVNAIEGLVVSDIAAIDGHSGFRSLAEWTALASAAHWGHQHVRRIRFRALMELAEVDGAWKITGITVVDTRQES